MSDPAATPDAGGDAASGTPVEGAAAASNQPAIDKGDFEARLKSDPDFALAEYKKAQSALTKAQNQLREVGELRSVAETLGQGDLNLGKQAVIQHLQNLGTLRGNPEMARIIDQYITTGKLPALDPYADGGAAEPVDPTAKELADLRMQLAEIRGERGKEKLVSLVETAFAELPLTKEEKADVLSFIETQAKGWASTEQGRQLLRSIDQKTVDALVLRKLKEDDALERVIERKIAARNQRNQGAATDPPPTNRNPGRDHPEFKTTKDALRHIREKYGIPEGSLLPQ